MMSIDHQKNHFKRSRDEIEEGDTKDQDANEIIKRRKVETTENNENTVIDNNNNNNQKDNSTEFQQKMYQSYIKSALDALDNNVSVIFCNIDIMVTNINSFSQHQSNWIH